MTRASVTPPASRPRSRQQSYDEVLPYFRGAENNRRGVAEYHGDEGPLAASDNELSCAIPKAFTEAAERAHMDAFVSRLARLINAAAEPAQRPRS